MERLPQSKRTENGGMSDKADLQKNKGHHQRPGQSDLYPAFFVYQKIMLHFPEREW